MLVFIMYASIAVHLYASGDIRGSVAGLVWFMYLIMPVVIAVIPTRLLGALPYSEGPQGFLILLGFPVALLVWPLLKAFRISGHDTYWIWVLYTVIAGVLSSVSLSYSSEGLMRFMFLTPFIIVGWFFVELSLALAQGIRLFFSVSVPLIIGLSFGLLLFFDQTLVTRDLIGTAYLSFVAMVLSKIAYRDFGMNPPRSQEIITTR